MTDEQILSSLAQIESGVATLKKAIVGPERSKPEYPYIGQYRMDGRLLVLFEAHNFGRVIRAGSTWNVGDSSNGWDEGVFIPCEIEARP